MFMPALRKSSESLDAKTTKVIHSAPEGLNKQSAESQLSRIAAEGNAKIGMKGKDDAGGRISGNNESFKLTVPVKSVPAGVRRAAKKLFEIFQEQIAHGSIQLPPSDESISGSKVLRRIVENTDD